MAFAAILDSITGRGGISIELRSGGSSHTIEFEGDGTIELLTLRDGHFVRREDFGRLPV